MYLVPQSADNVTNKGALISQPDDAKRTMSPIHKDREVTKSARGEVIKNNTTENLSSLSLCLYRTWTICYFN